jgi:uncharacterized protein (DUF697 family)
MALNVLKDIRKIYAGLNTDEIRGAAYRDLNIGLVAASEEAYREMEQFFAPLWLDGPARAEALKAIHRVNGSSGSQFDFLLYEPGIPLPSSAYVFSPANAGQMVRAIIADHDNLELAIARRFPLFRRPAVDNIIHRVSRENALFSLVTALPNVIPSVIDLPWAVGEFATDTAFLTMNQIRMALLMAGAHGRTIGYAEQKAQIAVIVAGAFGWRALARELVGKIPLGGGLIPKAAVAFAGTYVVGLGLEKVNRTGSGLSRPERKDAYADAFARGKEAVRDLAPTVSKHL